MGEQGEGYVAHEAFQGAGVAPGLEIWRIEQFEPVRQEENTHGVFYSGDCYIVLSTKEIPGHSKFQYDAHFWLGKESSADESGSAAIRTVELDDHLAGAAVQHREVQGHESKQFLAYFKKGIRYKKGGVESGFRKVDLTKYEKRLFQVKGKRNIRVEQVECKCASLNQGDVFILDDGPNMYVWIGPKSSKMERIKGVNIARSIRDDEKAGRSQIHIVENDWDTNPDFFKALGSHDKVIRSAAEGGTDYDIEKKMDQEIVLYKLTPHQTEEAQITEVDTKPLSQSMLDSHCCYVLDSGYSGIFVWTGKQSPNEFKLKVWKGVNEFISYRGYPGWVSVTRVTDGGESPLFKQYFLDWRDAEETLVTPDQPVAGGNIAQTSYEEFDATKMHQKVQKAEEYLPDDGTGKLEVWRIDKNQLTEVPEEAHGMFFAGDSYLMLYTYMAGTDENYIIYFWQGLKSKIEDKAASAFQAVDLDDKLGGKAVQIRVVMNKEPKHFLKMFNGKVIVFSGGSAEGFRGVHDNDLYDPKETWLFQIRGTDDTTTRAIMVESRASSLSSNDVFIVDSPRKSFVWIGANSGEQEAEMCKQMVDFVAPYDNRPEPTVLEEGSESMEFWNALGGQEDYYKGPREKTTVKVAPRLFHCSNTSGRFMVEQVCDYDQEDLDEDDIMILDTFDEVFVWMGSGANDFEKREAMKTAYAYLDTDPTGRKPDNTLIIVVRQGFEPPQFTGHFLAWDRTKWSEGKTFDEIVKEVGEENVGITTLEQEAEKYERNYPIEQLRRKLPPEGVDVTCKEQYLSDEDFVQVFGMSKDEFTRLPEWKRINKKKEAGLF